MNTSSLFLFFVVVKIYLINAQPAKDDQKALEFITLAEKELHETGINFTEISWTYATNITDYNEEQEKEYQVCFKDHFFHDKIQNIIKMQ